MAAWVYSVQLERDILLFKGRMFVQWSKWLPWTVAFWRKNPLLPWRHAWWRESGMLPWNHAFWWTCPALPWTRPFWRRYHSLPWNWELWGDENWQKFARINIGLWIPNTILFGVVVFFVGHGLLPALLQTVSWDILVLLFIRKLVEEFNGRGVSVQTGVKKRLPASAASFFYHKILVFLLAAYFLGTGPTGLIVARGIQAVIGIAENPAVWLYSKHVVFGQIRVRDLPIMFIRCSVRRGRSARSWTAQKIKLAWAQV